MSIRCYVSLPESNANKVWRITDIPTAEKVKNGEDNAKQSGKLSKVGKHQRRQCVIDEIRASRLCQKMRNVVVYTKFATWPRSSRLYVVVYRFACIEVIDPPWMHIEVPERWKYAGPRGHSAPRPRAGPDGEGGSYASLKKLVSIHTGWRLRSFALRRTG